jgi:hypothetical protein
MIWPRLRASPAPRSRSASRHSATCAATPWATGRNPDSQDIVSGAGRNETRRSLAAPLLRSTNACGSSR